MKSPFSSLPTPKPDPLFAIAAEAEKAGSDAINGTLGIYMDEDGQPLVFSSVKKALAELEKNLQTFNYSYPLLTGLPTYRDAVSELICPNKNEVLASIASTGGTGALAINLRLLRMLVGDAAPMIIPTPAWANHMPVCKWAGFRVEESAYLVDGVVSIDPLVETIKKQTGSFGILLQVGCHNPTGLDFSEDQWRSLLDALVSKQCVVLLDFAYQGFKGEPEDDRLPLKMCLDRGLTTLVTWSASKNHSIYGLRTGLAGAFVKDMTEKKTVEGTYSNISRGLHSAAPTFGQAIVALTQQRHQDEWRSDLRDARVMMKKKRDLMLKNLPSQFENCLKGYGMFAMLPLSETQVTKLKTDHQVFLPLDGRVNIAGIPEKKIGALCERILRVL